MNYIIFLSISYRLRWKFIKENKKHAFDRESDQENKKKKKENTLSTKKVIKKKR